MSDDTASVLDDIFKGDPEIDCGEGATKSIAENIRLAHKPQKHPRLSRGTERTSNMPKKDKKPRATAPNGLGKCAFIDALYIEGGHTKSEICAKTIAAFPCSDTESIKTTVAIRPYQIRKSGGEPKYNPEPKAQAA